MRRSVATVAVLLSFNVLAQEGWEDENGRLAPNTDHRRVVSGFGGWLVVTADADWREKWETPQAVIPRFNEARAVARGGKLSILTFFTNPALDGSRHANVTCDIDVLRPDGSFSVREVGVKCYTGPIPGDSRNVYLSKPVLVFVAEANDPLGEWLVHVTLIDNVRHISLPLKTSFALD